MRGTLCLSSQVGCALNCTFCHTGTQKFEGNLTGAEILKQFLALPREIQSLITNFVFMGQGEPLLNFRNLKAAVAALSDPHGLAISRNKITVSTSGIVPLMPKVATELGVNLAISLHAPNEELRSELMPINKSYSLRSLIDACKEFSEAASCATRRVSFEYTMLDSINDQPLHAKQLAELITGLPAHVNLIPFNPWPGSPYKSSPRARIEKFQADLIARGIPTNVRKTRGQDILAACGQLKSSIASKQQGHCSTKTELESQINMA